MNYEQWFLSELPAINKAIAQVCRRHRLRDEEAEEFASDVRLHFVENNYEVLRRFEQRSSLHTYLIVVINRRFLNYRNRLWGRWRPSAEAVRLGPVAALLERLTSRDGCSFDAAVEQMQTNHAVEKTREELHAVWLRLAPPSGARRFVNEELAREVFDPAPGPESAVMSAEREFAERRARVALERALQTLSSQDRLVLKMRYDDGFAVSDIARTLNINQKKLYRTFDRIHAQLRARVEAEGVSAADIREGTRG